MKIKHILAVIVLSGSALMMTPQQAKAASFYFHLDFGSDLYSFYPYRYDLWPVYGYHHFSSPYYYTHLHYYFPLISYYQPVYYYPLVPYGFARLYYSPRFYHHVYTYYRQRPYVHNRYYYDKSRIYGHRRQHHTYYKPSRYHRSYRSTPDYSYRARHRLSYHDRTHAKKRHYTNRDFRHPHRIDGKKKPDGRKHLQRDHRTVKQKGNYRQQKNPAEIAGRLIHRNKYAHNRKNIQHHRDHRQLQDTRDNRKHTRLDNNKRQRFPVAGTGSSRNRQFAGPSPKSFINEGARNRYKKDAHSKFNNRQHNSQRHDIRPKSRRGDSGYKGHIKRKWEKRRSSAGRSLSRHKGHLGKRGMLRMQR